MSVKGESGNPIFVDFILCPAGNVDHASTVQRPDMNANGLRVKPGDFGEFVAIPCAVHQGADQMRVSDCVNRHLLDSPQCVSPSRDQRSANA
jgi:archaellum component FlaG (FlaF/FlaG flagellin family)